MIDIYWILRWVKTVAWFDVWTFEHILSWLSMWHAVRKSNHTVFKKKLWLEKSHITTRYFDIIGVLFVAYLRETIEHYLESWLTWESVKYWFQWVEFRWNRIIADPLMMVIWYLIAKKYPRLIMPARVLSIVRLLVHIFVFPHSMYLHHL
jgi:hypothetical protein